MGDEEEKARKVGRDQIMWALEVKPSLQEEKESEEPGESFKYPRDGRPGGRQDHDNTCRATLPCL